MKANFKRSIVARSVNGREVLFMLSCGHTGAVSLVKDRKRKGNMIKCAECKKHYDALGTGRLLVNDN